MLIWIIIACLTVAALLAVLWPVIRGAAGTAPRHEFDRAVFEDQLAELDRDVARGVIGESEADAARNEISRRLLAVSDAPVHVASAHGRKLAAIMAVIAIPVIAVPLYLRAGAPGLPDVPLRDRIAAATANGDFDAMVAQVEEHLKSNPTDVKGWQVLAPAYARMNRFQDAANAYARLVDLGAATGQDYADLAEMIIDGNQGMVTADATRALGEALRRDPKNPKARFFTGLSLKQEGKANEAVAAWKALLADSPADAPWRSTVDQEIAAVAAQDMKPADQQAMIRGMVDGLEERLKTEGNDLAGWQKLINARNVLGETDKARAAYEAAKAIFKDKPEALASLDELARSLNIQ